VLGKKVTGGLFREKGSFRAVLLPR